MAVVQLHWICKESPPETCQGCKGERAGGSLCGGLVASPLNTSMWILGGGKQPALMEAALQAPKITDCTRTENLTVTSCSPAPLCAWGVGAGLPILQAAKPKSRKPLALGTQPLEKELD